MTRRQLATCITKALSKSAHPDGENEDGTFEAGQKALLTTGFLPAVIAGKLDHVSIHFAYRDIL